MVKIASCNINYWHDAHGSYVGEQIVSFLSSTIASADVLCLQNVSYTQRYLSTIPRHYRDVKICCAHFSGVMAAKADCSSASEFISSLKQHLGLPLTAVISVYSEDRQLVIPGELSPEAQQAPVPEISSVLFITIMHPGSWAGVSSIHTSSALSTLIEELKMPHVFCFPVATNSTGSVLLSKFPVTNITIQNLFVTPNHLLSIPIVVLQTPDSVNFNLFIVSLSNEYTIRCLECNQLQLFLQTCKDLQPFPTFICGEFNAINRNEYTHAQWNHITKQHIASGRPFLDEPIYDDLLKEGFIDVLWGAPLQPKSGDIFIHSGKNRRTQYIFTSMRLHGCTCSALFSHDAPTKIDYIAADVQMSLRAC